MSIKKILLASALSGALAFGVVAIPADTADAEEVMGKVTKSERDGRTIHMGDKSAKISGSRTKVTIGGKEGDRADIKVGMECSADLKGASGSEAKTIDCK
ncbi:MAG: hypothetical protein V3R55_03615 [Alphaproteobacteria bacterium]